MRGGSHAGLRQPASPGAVGQEARQARRRDSHLKALLHAARLLRHQLLLRALSRLLQVSVAAAAQVCGDLTTRRCGTHITTQDARLAPPDTSSFLLTPCGPRVILVLCRRKARVLTRCSDCGRAFYCSEMCQELGRPLHWRECIVFRHRRNYQPKDFARFLARLIWVLKVRGRGEGSRYSPVT